MESAFQVLFNSFGLCVTMLTDLLAWTVIELCTKQKIQMIHQVYQSACNIKFIESVHLKYGIYKPREAEHPKKKLVRKRTRFFVGCSTSSVYKSHILNGPILNKLYFRLFSKGKPHLILKFHKTS